MNGIKPLYTVYGFKPGNDSAIRPCGMNDLVDLSAVRKPNSFQWQRMEQIAFNRGYARLIAYTDDTAYKIVNLL